MTDEQTTPVLPEVANLHAALMHGGMTYEQAAGVGKAIADYVDTLVAEHPAVQPPPPKAKKPKAKKAKAKRRR